MPWYIRSQSRIFGPLSDDDLRRLAREGRLTASHLVGKSAEGPWKKAADVRGLVVLPSTSQSNAATASGSNGATLRAGAARSDDEQDKYHGFGRLQMVVIGTILTALLGCVAVAAWALVTSLHSDRTLFVAETVPDGPAPEPPVRNELKPFNIVTRIERTSRLEKMHPIEAEGKFASDRSGTDDFLRHQKLVFEEKEVTECIEDAFDEPKPLSDYGSNQEFIKALSRTLKDTALAVALSSESSDPKRYGGYLSRLAILAGDLPEHERATIRRFALPAALRFAEGVTAAISTQDAARECAKDLEKIVETIAAIAAEPGEVINESLRPPTREAIATLDTVRNSVGMEFRLIPSGTFLMGTADPSKENELRHNDEFKKQNPAFQGLSAGDHEKPAHQVVLTKPFYIGVKEVSYSEFLALFPSSSRGSHRPNSTSNRNEIDKFLAKLSELPVEKAAGRKYRLPTEAEWEYACRAGTTTTYSFGDDAKWLSLYIPSYYFDYRPARCNQWGLYGMHDDSNELVSDLYGPYSDQSQTDPSGPSFGAQRIVRGGRSASRHAVQFDEKDKDFNQPVCFRVAFDAPSAAMSRAADVQALADADKLEEANEAYRDAIESGAGRPSLRASTLALAHGWLSRVDKMVADGATVDNVIAGCNAVRAACVAACQHGCSEEQVNPLLSNQFVLQAIAYNNADNITAAVERMLEALAVDSSMAIRFGLSGAGVEAPRLSEKEKQATDKKKASTKESERLTDQDTLEQDIQEIEVTRQRGMQSRFNNSLVDSARVLELADEALRFEPPRVDFPAEGMAAMKCRPDARLCKATLDGWRKKLDAALSDNDVEEAFQLIGDAKWLDAETIRSLPPICNSLGIKLQLIAPGEFTMGDPFGEKDESPHKVVLSTPFFIGVYELKRTEVERLIKDYPTPSAGSTDDKTRRQAEEDKRRLMACVNHSQNQDMDQDDRPIQGVDWQTAAIFCRDLSKLPAECAGERNYRLPTEAEWEYACKAGSTTRWSFGNDENLFGEYGWLDSKEGAGPHTVGKKKPNGWGLYDMHGNVAEWVADWYGEYPTREQRDPSGPYRPEKAAKVFRGGDCFAANAGSCRSARRERWRGGLGQGFRIAVTPVSCSPVNLSALERLKHKISLTRADATFVHAVQLFSDEIGIPVIIEDNVWDLKDKHFFDPDPGVTYSTRAGLKEGELTGEEILQAILSTVDREKQLKYLVRRQNGYETLVIFRSKTR
jgi:formylglycine-generating enzyme required for sulfatase activity